MSALLDLINDPKNLDHVVTIAIAIVSSLVGTIAIMGAIMVKNYKAKVSSEISRNSQSLMTRFDDKHVLQDQKIGTLEEYEKENRRSLTQAHNRITDHVEKHHTKD